jgi:hypothetical protein
MEELDKQGQEEKVGQQVQVPKKEGEVERQEDVHTTKTSWMIHTHDFPIRAEKKVTTVKGKDGNYGKYTKIVHKSVDD